MCTGSGHKVPPASTPGTGMTTGRTPEQDEAYWQNLLEHGSLGDKQIASKKLREITATKGIKTPAASSTSYPTPSATARLGLRIETPKVTVDSLKIPLPVTPNGSK